MGKPHKHAEVIKAWADGAIIECFETDGKWYEVTPSWQEESIYRIKPERVYPESSLSDNELEDLYSNSADYLQHTEALKYIANQAVKRHIQDQEASQ